MSNERSDKCDIFKGPFWFLSRFETLWAVNWFPFKASYFIQFVSRRKNCFCVVSWSTDFNVWLADFFFRLEGKQLCKGQGTIIMHRNLDLSTGLIMWIGHRKEIRKLSFATVKRFESFRNSRWPIHIINPVDKTKLICYTPHRRRRQISDLYSNWVREDKLFWNWRRRILGNMRAR